MIRLPRPASLVVSVPLLAALLTLVMSGVAAADTYHGQHADYIFTDGSSSSTGATCVYTYPNANLKTLIVKAPKLWWPDSIAEKHHEHGTVGWRAMVRTSMTPDSSTFHTVYSSPIQRATAYEDQDVPYGDATRAPLTKRTIDWHHARYGHVYIQVVVQALWYAKDGSVKGWVKHPVAYLKYTYGPDTNTFTNWCNNEGLAG